MFIGRNRRSLIRCGNGAPREFVSINCYKLARPRAALSGREFVHLVVRLSRRAAESSRGCLNLDGSAVTHAWTRDRVSRRARFNITRKLSTRWKARRRDRRGLFFS